MPKRKPVDEDKEVVMFGDAAASSPAGRRGPKERDNTLAKRIEAGTASHLHGIVSTEVHRQIKIRAVVEGRTLSEVLEAAVREYLERHR